ncbi:MAG: YdcF family protein [Anaerolineales bacterium]
MYVFLSKTLPPLIYPLGLATILLLIGIVFAKRTRLTRIILWVAFGLLWLGGNRLVAYQLARSLEWRYLPPKDIPSAPLMIVLGGGTFSANYPRTMPEVNGAGDRLFYAAKLYQEGKAPKILLSGGAISWYTPSGGPAEDMAVLIQMLGVPSDALIIENNSQNTYENARNSKEILHRLGVNRVILVTSAMHMPRAVKIFQRQGIDVTPAPTDYTVTQAGWETMTALTPASIILDLIPSADNLSLTTRVLKEYIGLQTFDLFND